MKSQVRSHHAERINSMQDINSELDFSNPANFDQAKIIDHYVRLKEIQQERLSTINLSEELKRKLFGFSQGYYLTNDHDPYRLIMENHPLKGRTIMTPEKFYNKMHKEQQVFTMKKKDEERGSSQKLYDCSILQLDSDIQVPINSKMQWDANPEQNIESSVPFRQNSRSNNQIY